MMKSNLYETIFKRKSVRKYDVNPLEDGILSEIKEYANTTKGLYDNIKTEIHIIKKEELNFLLPIKAPHYLLMTSENKTGYLTNAGYILQQIDLFLSSKGIGCCYVGMAQPKKAIKKGMDLEFVMVLALGNPAEPFHRIDTTEFKRKALSEITNITNSDQLLEAARLAPSATNSQPWYFTGEAGLIHAYCIKANLIKALVYDKMNKIDMGIAICHIDVAAEHFGKNMEFAYEKVAENNPPKGYYYIGTMKLK